MSYPEFVEFEKNAEQKHEFLRGEVLAMAGGSPEHAALALAVGAELRQPLRGKPCRVYSSDAAVYVEATDLQTYPDVSVVCGELKTASENKHAITNPVVLVEVLSASTEGYDRGAKAGHYRQLGSLHELVFLAQDEPRIEVQRRGESGQWEIWEARRGESIELRSLGISLSVDAVYQNPIGPEIPPSV